MPIEEITTPNSNNDEHFRNVSELPVDFAHGNLDVINHDIDGISEHEDKGYTESAAMNNNNAIRSLQSLSEDITNVSSLSSNNIATLDLECEQQTKKNLRIQFNEQTKTDDEDNIIENDERQILALSDLQNDPFCRLFFADIGHDKVEKNVSSDISTLQPNEEASSVYVSPNEPGSENGHHHDMSPLICSEDDVPSRFLSHVIPNEETNFATNNNLYPSIETVQKEPTFYVLHGETNKSMISDLRKELRKDPSCRSLLSDSSNNDVQVIVDASLIQDTSFHTPIGLRSNASFNSLKTSVSSASKRTKGSIQRSFVKTTDGVKKMHTGVKIGASKTANIVQGGMKKSVVVVQHGMKKTIYVVHDSAKKTNQVVQKQVKKSTDFVQEQVQKTVSGMKYMGAKSLKLATTLIKGSEDGKVRDGGFVTFNTLSAKNACVQMLHHEEPFTFRVSDAPLPKDVYWNNVGLTHRKHQIGFLVAQGATFGLCLFWTLPVAFVVSCFLDCEFQ